MRNHKKLSALLAGMLAVSMILPVFSSGKASAAEIKKPNHEIVTADPESPELSSYFDMTNNSTAGKVMTDKTVRVNENGQGFDVTLSALAQSKEEVKLDVVFVVDTSDSMNENKAARAKMTTDVLNMAMKTLLPNTDNRVAIATFNDSGSVFLPLDHWGTQNTAGDYLKYTSENGGNGGSTEASFSTVPGLRDGKGNMTSYASKTASMKGGTYTQAGLVQAYNIFSNDKSDKTGRTPVVIFMSDGEPTYGTPAYNDVSFYSGTDTTFLGDGKDSNKEAMARSAYLSILSAIYYKNAIDQLYQEHNVLFYTIGLDVNSQSGKTMMNPTKENIDDLGKADSEAQARFLYQYLSKGVMSYTKAGNEEIRVESPYHGDYRYADASFAGEMNEDRLNQILSEIISNITKAFPAPVVGDIVITDVLGVDMRIGRKLTVCMGNAQYSLRQGADGTYVSSAIPGLFVELVEENGKQAVKFHIPEKYVPANFYGGEFGADNVEKDPISLSYTVDTDKKSGIFYEAEEAYAEFALKEDNDYYEKNAPLTIVKEENPTDTASNIYTEVYTQTGKKVKAALGNNGKLLKVADKYFVLDYGKDVLVGEDKIYDFTEESSLVGMKENTMTGDWGVFSKETDRENGRFRYSLSKFMNGVDTFSFEGCDAGTGLKKDINFLPANNIYYEDDFNVTPGGTDSSISIVYTGEWQSAGASKGDGTQSPDNTVYGQDPSYEMEKEFSSGTAHKGTDGAKAEFKFKGTAVDIYSRSSSDACNVYAFLYDAAGKMIKYALVNNYGDAGTYYMVPTVSFRNLPYGEYRVELNVVKNPQVSAAVNYYLDGIRVYHPLGEVDADSAAGEAYREAEEMNAVFTNMRSLLLDKEVVLKAAEDGESAGGATYIDQTDSEKDPGQSTAHTVDIETYRTAGPKNEIYLGQGNGIAFRLENFGEGDAVYAAVKSLQGTESTVEMSWGDGEKKFYPVNSTSEQYKKLIPDSDGNVVIMNTGEGIISLTQVRMTSPEKNDIQFVTDGKTVAAAARFAALRLVPSEEETETPDVEIENPKEEVSKPAEKLYHIEIEGGTLADGRTEGDFPYNTKITLTPAEAEDGKQFEEWQVNGKTVSIDDSFSFFVGADMKVKAVYSDSETEEAKLETAAFLQNISASRNDSTGKYDLRYLAQITLPKEMKLVDAGLVWTNKAAEVKEEQLKLESEGQSGVKITRISKISTTGQFSVTIKGVPSGICVPGKIFAVYSDSEGGRHTVYSDLGTGSAE